MLGLPHPGFPTTPEVPSLTIVAGTLPADTPRARSRAAAPVMYNESKQSVLALVLFLASLNGINIVDGSMRMVF